MYDEIMPKDVERLVNEKKKISIIDVREPIEFAGGHIPGAKNISVNEIPDRINEIDKTGEHIVVCQSGTRSELACTILSANGFKVKNMIGGMSSWTGRLAY
ncbi:rhodanese-like domain-containing protein [Sporolactobacillus sp. THM7-7]|nr:rhodanese-like domain-containing protein [Sporolactobacillus sp. THM7-7]